MIHLPVITDSERDHVRPDLCGPCGGKCCKASPGIASPEDFGAPDLPTMRRRIRDALASGLWAVDWWEGDPRPNAPDWDEEGYMPRACYVRPAERGKEGIVRDPSWGGECTFHGPDGCRIFATRPQGCRDVVPAKKGSEYHCSAPGAGVNPKHTAALAWLPYNDEIEAIGREVIRMRDGAA